MLSHVFVHQVDDFKKWLDDASNWEKRMTPLEAGKQMVQSNGCVQCHSVDGKAGNGPTFRTLFGSEVPLSDGSKCSRR